MKICVTYVVTKVMFIVEFSQIKIIIFVSKFIIFNETKAHNFRKKEKIKKLKIPFILYI